MWLEADASVAWSHRGSVVNDRWRLLIQVYLTWSSILTVPQGYSLHLYLVPSSSVRIVLDSVVAIIFIYRYLRFFYYHLIVSLRKIKIFLKNNLIVIRYKDSSEMKIFVIREHFSQYNNQIKIFKLYNFIIKSWEKPQFYAKNEYNEAIVDKLAVFRATNSEY